MVELSREQQAVLACARYPMRPEGVSLEGLNWEQFFRIAQSWDVTTLVAGNLLAHCRERLPSDIASRLHQVRHASLALSARMAARTAEVVGWFTTAGIDVLLFKGVALTALLYDSPLLRQSSDVDVMVHPLDVFRARDVLQQRGFISTFAMKEQQWKALVHFGSAHDFRSADGKLMVDLHWDVPWPLCPLDMEQVWARAQTLRVDNRNYRTLSREDYLLFLCYHPIKHCYRGLRIICDIAALLNSSEAWDWEYVQHQAKRAGAQHIVWLGVGLAKAIFDAKLPLVIERQVNDSPKLDGLVQQAKEALFGRLSPWRNKPTIWGLRILDGGRNKACFFFKKLLLPNEEELALISIPEPFWFAYYGLRVVRIPYRYARILMRLKNTVALSVALGYGLGK